MRIWKLALTALVLPLVVGCQSTTRLIADFEADTVGALPSTTPAGGPDDTIGFFGITSAGHVAVEASDILQGERVMRLSRVGAKEVNFGPEPLTGGQKLFAGVLLNPLSKPQPALLRFDFSEFGAAKGPGTLGGNCAPIGAGVLLTTVPGSSPPQGAVSVVHYEQIPDSNCTEAVVTEVGQYSSNQTFSVLMSLDPTSVKKEMKIGVLPLMSEAITVPIAVPDSADVLDTTKFLLSFVQNLTDSGAAVLVDNVVITEKNPPKMQ